MQFSGLNHQMITLWNKKYKIFREDKIDRDSVFNKFDLKKLIYVSFLTDSNKKFTVERLCSMSVSELQVLSEFEVQNYIQKSNDYQPIIRLLVSSCFSYDDKSFDAILSICFKKMGIEECCFDLIFPFISQIVDILKSHSIEQSVKSFTRNLIRNHLHYYITLTSHEVKADENRRWLYFLPEGEKNDIELLFVHLYFKTNGENGILLGENQAVSTVVQCLESIKITHVFLFIEKEKTLKILPSYLEEIKKIAPEVTIFVASETSLKDKVDTDVSYVNVNVTTPREFNVYLERIKNLQL